MAHTQRGIGTGVTMVLLASAAFGTSGPFAKALIVSDWSPGAVVLIRIAGAALLLAPLALWSIKGRWSVLIREVPLAAGYGALAVAAAQLGYFQAVARLEVGVALLIEYLGIVLVVGWAWAVTRRRPHRLTVAGTGLAVAGLVLVLDVAGQAAPDPIGVGWALLAAIGLAGHYVLGARPTELPPFAFATIGLASGAGILAVLGGLGVIPMRVGSDRVSIGAAAVPASLALVELVVVAAALAYVLGIVGARRLGSTLASFVGLTEVLFAILVAWVVLVELPGPSQLFGGAVLLTGVIVVRLGERARTRPANPVDFDVASPVA
jgi:drug/metabolite transporter (DMT)-like permease